VSSSNALDNPSPSVEGADDDDVTAAWPDLTTPPSACLLADFFDFFAFLPSERTFSFPFDLRTADVASPDTPAPPPMLCKITVYEAESKTVVLDLAIESPTIF
jgi:hypothetical protein